MNLPGAAADSGGAWSLLRVSPPVHTCRGQPPWSPLSTPAEAGLPGPTRPLLATRALCLAEPS